MILENRTELFSILKQHSQVKALICGHIHQKLDSEKENKLIFGTPSSCFQFKPYCTEYTLDHKAPGYRVFRLYPDGGIESEVIRLST